MKKLSLLLITIIVFSIFTRTDAINVADSFYFDIGIVAIRGPDRINAGNTARFSAIIENYGGIFVINYPVLAYIEGTPYVSTRLITLSPGDSIEIIFDLFTFFTPGTYVFVCTIGMNDSNPSNNSMRKTIVVLPLGIEQEKSISTYQSLTLYPNPFTSNLQISSSSNLTLNIEVYNVNGALIKTLSCKSPLFWNGNNNNNDLLPAGVYFLKSSENDNQMMCKVLLLR
jgi:hypothetical protein